jgi:hypothetical protein
MAKLLYIKANPKGNEESIKFQKRLLKNILNTILMMK